MRTSKLLPLPSFSRRTSPARPYRSRDPSSVDRSRRAIRTIFVGDGLRQFVGLAADLDRALMGLAAWANARTGVRRIAIATNGSRCMVKSRMGCEKR